MPETDIIQTLTSAGIHFVRVLWCDNANVIRGKAIHLGALQHYLTDGVGISAAQQALPVMYDAPAIGSGLGPVGGNSLSAGLVQPQFVALCTRSWAGNGKYEIESSALAHLPP
jgi:hypothetical protein